MQRRRLSLGIVGSSGDVGTFGEPLAIVGKLSEKLIHRRGGVRGVGPVHELVGRTTEPLAREVGILIGESEAAHGARHLGRRAVPELLEFGDNRLRLLPFPGRQVGFDERRLGSGIVAVRLRHRFDRREQLGLVFLPFLAGGHHQACQVAVSRRHLQPLLHDLRRFVPHPLADQIGRHLDELSDGVILAVRADQDIGVAQAHLDIRGFDLEDLRKHLDRLLQL